MSTISPVPITVHAFNNQKDRFGDDYPLPFVVPYYEDEWGDAPRSFVELTMYQLSATLREKSDWHVKVNDTEIRRRWREEALAHPASRPEWKLTEKMVDYVLDELAGYAKVIDETTGIQVGCYERIWRSDRLVPQEIRDALLAGVAKLEDVPEDKKDWHPGSNGQVLDLVHPSLFPVVYDKTLWSPKPGESPVPVPTPTSGANLFASHKYSWMPSDFEVSENGSVTLVSPYINNLHPTQHRGLYASIENIVALAVPLWERVLSDLQRPLTPLRLTTGIVNDFCGNDNLQTMGCIWKNGKPWPQDFEEWTDEQFDAFYSSHPDQIFPDAVSYEGALDAITKTVTLAGTTLQVIVKLANIILTPEHPKYAGGTWHVEGMQNEGIVSTFIYYYDEENITQSCLAFRTATMAPLTHEQDDDLCMTILYNMGRNDALVQNIGGIPTSTNRCIAFPNIYQHQVQPFELQEKSKSGHRKILALFLINPSHTIPSATNIAPQQREWIVPELEDSLSDVLPGELIELIWENNDHLMAWDEAVVVREAVMKERSVMIQENTKTAYGAMFNMCEH